MNPKISNNKQELAIALLLSFNIGLVIFRVFYSTELRFIFLIWNLILATIPYFLMKFALKSQVKNIFTLKKPVKNLVVWLLFGASLLFLPNSPYIVTDLFHLKHQASMPLWFDTLLVFSCAATGLFLFYSILMKMAHFLIQQFSKIWSIIGIVMIIFLNGFGIYLGRFLRFNSWDIVTNPLGLASEILDRFIHPFAHGRTWGVTLGYGTLFLIGYVLVQIFSREKVDFRL